ncbi:MAG: tetratricopeptide repeat protein, partial [Alphaproteobacteria bacterium]|nr:tetratricopeptide repeat protein [Alphaproteobacteria bacterium]
MLKYLLVHKSSQKKISITHYLYIGIISIIIAAAGPTWKKIEIPTLTIENPNMFVLSLSQDMQLKDVTPSRLERAKFIISDLAEDVEEGQFGLEVYSQEPYIITPLTDDTKLIKNLLPQIVANIVPDQGDRLDRAIDLAIERFKSANYTNGNILIFASDVGQRFDLVISKIEKAVQSNFAITVIDMSYSENDKLRMLSEKANGFYFSARNGNIKELIQHLKLKRQEKMTISENLRSTFIDYGYYLVFIALFCMLPFFRRGLLVLFLSVLFSSPAFAGFWTNSNQDGFNLFQSGNYEKASQTFKDPLWKGISLYKQDKKEEALATFSQIKNKNALYNSGVVLTKLCQYEKALDAFNKTLEIDPEHRDALYNKKVLEDLFEKAKTDPSVLNCGENKQKD